MKISLFDRKNQPVKQEYCDDSQIPGLSDLYVPQEHEAAPVEPEQPTAFAHDIADVLLDMKKLTADQYEKIRAGQSQNPDTQVEQILIDSGLIAQDDILMAKARVYGLEFRNIDPDSIEQQAFELLDPEYIKTHHLMPVSQNGDVVEVATSDPSNVFAIEDLKSRLQMSIEIVVCTEEDIEAGCRAMQENKLDYSVDDIISDMTDVEVVHDEIDENEDLEKMAGQSPVIKFVNYLISNAIREGASDIHLEPKTKITKVRYRIDGALFEMMQSPIKMHPALVSRIKIMSDLDISERRLPQDGKISVKVGGRAIDLRVSTLPTNNGEKVVIRVLDSKSISMGLEDLGMEKETEQQFSNQVAMPHGILLVTGPTGSGKSTTLYSALNQMDGDQMNISTVEDPVEYELEFCNQVQVIDKIGLTFASALRSLLRQDPDIIMIGEIRDTETARIAVQAALTGHLVLSTLHTNDAASSITRLVNIGIDPYLIAAALNGVLAQRLVRKVCEKCKEPYNLPENMQKICAKAGLNPEELFHGVGCDNCRGSGYSGRVGIYEMLLIDDAFRDMINKDPSTNNMRKAFIKSGRDSLFDDGIKKIKLGLTTLEEVLRVTEVYGKHADEEFIENQ